MVSGRIDLPSPEPLTRDFARDTYVTCPDLFSPQLVKAMRDKALALVRRHARPIDHQDTEHVLRYRVVTGEMPRREWPEILELYDSSAIRQWVAPVTGSP